MFLDAWAHNNLAQLETFFTPWHAVLYSGFVALAGWMWLDPTSVVFALSNPLDGSVPRGGLLPGDLASQIVVTGTVLLAPLQLLAPPLAGAGGDGHHPVRGRGRAVRGHHGVPAPVGYGDAARLGSARGGPPAAAGAWEGRRGAFLSFGALAPLVTWSVYLAVASARTGHLPTVVEYWTGIPMVTALLGLVLAVLMQPTGSARHLDRIAAGDVPGAVRNQIAAGERPLR
jgi:hypothetical protein